MVKGITMKTSSDEISIVESMYNLGLPDSTWISELTHHVARNLDADLGVVAIKVRADCAMERFARQPFFVDVAEPIASGLGAALAEASGVDKEIHRVTYARRLGVFREEFAPTHEYRRRCAPSMLRARAKDNVAFSAFDTPARSVLFSLFFSREVELSNAARRRYQQLSAHLTVALRLRGCFNTEDASGLGADTQLDAVFDPGGHCLHASSDGKGTEGLVEALRAAVVARETARGALRARDPDRALNLWSAVTTGHWSLVDHIERDGRRLVLAIRNEGGFRNPRSLSAREAEVARLAASGATNKEIGFVLRLSVGCVATHLHSACRKLKCRSRGDLVRMARSMDAGMMFQFHGAALGATVDVGDAGAEAAAFGAARLTNAERAVLNAIRRGQSNAEIAMERGSSQKTIANQVAAILRKTSRNSRFELMLDACE